MRRFYTFLLCLALQLAVAGCVEIDAYDSPMAQGQITDSVSLKPIAGAIVSMKFRPTVVAHSQSDGTFGLSPAKRRTRIFAIGPYDAVSPGGLLVVSANGYQPKEIATHEGLNNVKVALDPVH